MVTLAQTEARLRRLEAHAAMHRPQLRVVARKPTIDERRTIAKMRVEMGLFAPTFHWRDAKDVAWQRRVAQALWPDQFDAWLAEAGGSLTRLN